MLDAPVSGGVAGAAAGSLTFMVGGEAETFARAEPVLAAMGKAVIHAGRSGTGQAAKICNNMMLGIQMISVCEAMALAPRLGLSPDKLFEISSRASGQCWSLTSYCPVPGPVPTSPANRDYAAGIYRRDDAEGSTLGSTGGADSGHCYATGRGSLPAIRPFRGPGERGAGFFRHNQDDRGQPFLGRPLTPEDGPAEAGGKKAPVKATEVKVKDHYLVTIRLIERLHRRFLDVIKAELDRLGIEDINNVQTLILSNIAEEQLTVGELTLRGYYLGSNVSYNVKKLVESGYLMQERSVHDKRQTRVKLSQKGLDLTSRINQLYGKNAEELEGKVVSAEQLRQLNADLDRYRALLERSDRLRPLTARAR